MATIKEKRLYENFKAINDMGLVAKQIQYEKKKQMRENFNLLVVSIHF